MVAFARFRSLWGVEPGTDFAEWRKRFDEWKRDGYNGVEVNIFGIDSQGLHLLRSLCDDIGIDVCVTIFSSWHQYEGPRPRDLTPDVHLGIYREQLRLASILKPVRVNVQSGADYWTRDESVYFYKKTFGIDEEMGLGGRVCHETHRNRSLFNPYVADYVLAKVPQLRLTADISHWVLVCERLLDAGEEDQEIMNRIIPHASTTQSSQCPTPLDALFDAERTFFEELWLKIIDSRIRNDKDAVITWVPEYGPFPYHAAGTAQSHGDLADGEGRRLEKLFNDRFAK